MHGNILNKNKVKLFNTANSDLAGRISILENNVYKITYYEIISGASGTLTVPTAATINSNEFSGANCVLSEIDVNNKPTWVSPKTAGGTVVTATLNTGTGAWVKSGVTVSTNVALIYSLNIRAADYFNLTNFYIIDEVVIGDFSYVLNNTTNNSVLSSLLSAAISDETGSGALVFGTQPTFTQWITVPRIYGGTSITDGIDFYSTSGNGTSGSVAHRFLGGNNGATTILTMLNDGTIRIPNNRNIQGVDSGGTNRNLITWSSGDNITITGRPGTTDIVLNPTSGGIGLYVKSGGDGGIGTASPAARWHIIKTTEQLRVGYDGSNYFSTTVSSVGNTTFALTGTSPTFTFNNSVKVNANDLQVGTGTMIGSLRGIEVSYTGNQSNIYVRNNSTSLKSVFLIGDSTYAKSVRFQYVGSTFATSGIEQADSSNLFSFGNKLNIGTYGSHDLTFWSNNTQRAVFDTSGNLVVGAGTASARLHTVSTTEQLRVGYNISNYVSHIVDSTGSLTLGLVGTTPEVYFNNTGGVVIGNKAALATNATNGFLYVPSCAGIPTGVPTAKTGKIAVVCDSTNNKMYIYSGGAWVALN